jgi:signal transduction histidine kinase
MQECPMHLASRLSAASALVGLAVFGVYGAVLVSAERRDLGRAVDREVAFLSASLRVGIENALRDGQVADVEETITKLDEVDAGVDVLVLHSDHSMWVAGPASLTPQRLSVTGDLADAVTVSGIARSIRMSDGGLGLLIHASPLFADDGAILGVLVVQRPLGDVAEDLGGTVGGISVTVGVFILLAASVGLLVSRFFLARPLDALLLGIRSVREGAVVGPLREDGDVEVAALASEFNRMILDLEAARTAVAQEIEARRVAQQALSTADRLFTLGQLSASVAHEIGSPLQVLQGRARALAERSTDPASRASAEVMVRETERITCIVAQVLSLGRRRTPSEELFDLETTIEEVAAVLGTEARRRDLTLAKETRPATVTGDPDQLKQVVLNLLMNAFQATPAGGHVWVRAWQEDGFALLQVEDDGVGVPPEALTHIFEPLFTTRADHGGTGLGLAVVKTIVESHRGAVACQSEPGHGATFTVRLPLRRAPEVLP